ncbi:hypothetical protein DCAR_0831430 [Daucus carota subsp. sativus]|uniref:Uncharacterized protein n=1 Tax=Daucus carota subsp. sativus TaxID=79200 RepID=A0A175YLW0_DAUCS|nr:PREDICTED: olee1-like protein [Daucus carota subsp. sativus]WOH11934.1 hypothetical protein DCAR_0831430 [Daucus carota subsp. sativus]
MPNPYRTIIVFTTTLYLLSIIQTAQSEAPKGSPSGGRDFKVQGQVYCDPCRVRFITQLSTFLKGATVRLECRNREQDTNLTFSGEATTDDTGTYHITVDDDHEDDICEVKLVKSPDPQCSEINLEKNTRYGARVSLAANSGMASNVRMASPICFLTNKAHEDCDDLIREIGLAPVNKT